MIAESFLHFLWEQKLCLTLPQQTVDGRVIEILNPGRYNTIGSGPDFFNAQIRLDGILFAGNVEMHVHSNDWFLHHHEYDAAYDNVILHVVAKYDGTPIIATNGQQIPTCELSYPDVVARNYDSWLVNPATIPCADYLNRVPHIFVTNFLEALLVERLQQKAKDIHELLGLYKGSWEEAFYVSLARNFGFHTNSLPFQLVARSLPLRALGRHRDRLQQVEAMLFGQAGLLVEPMDGYARGLLQEYRVLQAKFSLTPIAGHLWRTRMRPDNFPHVRIAEFAQLIHQSEHLFSRLLEAESIEEMRGLLEVRCGGYWERHYRFGVEGGMRPKVLGVASQNILLINTVLPYLFVYGQMHGREELMERALCLLEALPAEKNTKIEMWGRYGIRAQHSADSQALLQLQEGYCADRRCLQCRLGVQVLKRCCF